MDRLTRRTADGVELCFGEILVVSWPAQKAVKAALNRLAAYEDTDLTPERAAELAQAEAESNEPLTLEQLQDMDGDPVWVKPLGVWGLVNLQFAQVFTSVGDFDLGIYAATGRLYRHRTEEATGHV